MDVGAVITAIKASIDAAKAAKNMHGQAQLDAAISEIMEKLTTAQSALLSMLVQQQDLVQENSRLKEELAKEARFERYRLERTPMGGFILRLKEGYESEDEVAHSICHLCKEAGSRSILTENSYCYECGTCGHRAWKKPRPSRPSGVRHSSVM